MLHGFFISLWNILLIQIIDEDYMLLRITRKRTGCLDRVNHCIAVEVHSAVDPLGWFLHSCTPSQWLNLLLFYRCLFMSLISIKLIFTWLIRFNSILIMCGC
ncbi:hypothetical protein YC2023_017758 [Brassica napus]